MPIVLYYYYYSEIHAAEQVFIGILYFTVNTQLTDLIIIRFLLSIIWSLRPYTSVVFILTYYSLSIPLLPSFCRHFVVTFQQRLITFFLFFRCHSYRRATRHHGYEENNFQSNHHVLSTFVYPM